MQFHYSERVLNLGDREDFRKLGRTDASASLWLRLLHQVALPRGGNSFASACGLSILNRYWRRLVSLFVRDLNYWIGKIRHESKMRSAIWKIRFRVWCSAGRQY